MYTIHDNLIASDGKTADKGVMLLSVFNYTMKEKTKTEKPKVKKSKGKYTLAVKVDDVDYKGNADSMVQALTDFVASKKYPLGAKTFAVFSVSNGEKTYSEIWRVARCRKMFNLMSLKPTAIEIVAGKLEAALA